MWPAENFTLIGLNTLGFHNLHPVVSISYRSISAALVIFYKVHIYNLEQLKQTL